MKLKVSASPFIHGPDSVATIMWNVVGALVPIVAASFFFFGISALLVIAASCAGALATERGFGPGGTLRDGSAVITGILLGLTLPAGMPLWIAFFGGAFAIGVGKLLFGGLGYNIFNPALLGRAFLQAAFPVAITTWPAVGGSWWALKGDNFALPFMSAHTDALTAPTPLNLMKFEGQGTGNVVLALGDHGGSLGETSAILIVICGAYLAWRGFLNWRIPVSIVLTVGGLAALLHLANPQYPTAAFMTLSGGLMLGAVFMATDMVTAPVTNRGRWIFGAGIGALVVAIRLWSGLPEGVMYAILLMNAMVPFINRATQPRIFGAKPAQAKEGAT
ncbi:MAG TPA: RnfABCDGE type electron transport complex subunit D [Gemmatimonadaceae bacterium]